MTKIFLLMLVLFFSTKLTEAQTKLAYHSEYEKEILDQYISNIKSEHLDLLLISEMELSQESVHSIKKQYNDILESLKEKHSNAKSDIRYLSWLFYKIHRKYLKTYTNHASLASTFQSGKYDCLTATSLYALLLNDLGYSPRVIETKYHIYLKLDFSGEEVLIESTDPINGFITSPSEIEVRLSDYQRENDFSEDADHYQFQASMNNEVSLYKLAGLHYFNTAVEHYNQMRLTETVVLLEKASLFYASDRITEFGLVLANAIKVESRMTDVIKVNLLRRISEFLLTEDNMAVR